MAVDMFQTISGNSYKFWNSYQDLSVVPVPTDQVSGLDFSTDLITASVGTNFVKKGTDVVSRSNTGGVDGYYASLEGEVADDSGLVTDATSLSLVNNLSVSIWVYLPIGYSSQEYQQDVWSQKADSTSDYRRISVSPDGTLKALVHDIIDGQSSFIHPTKLTEGVWHHVAYVCDGITQKIFLDGIKHSSELSFSPIVYGDWFSLFGKYDNGGDSFSGAFKGRIDVIRLYNYILSDKQVEALSNEFTP